MNIFRYIFLFLTGLLAFSSCDEDLEEIYAEFEESPAEVVKIASHEFSPDHKFLHVNLKEVGSLNDHILNDSSSVKVDASFGRESLFGITNRYYSRMIGIKDIGKEIIDSLNMSMLVLVDLTLPQHVVDAEYYAVREIRNMIPVERLYVSFITDTTVTESVRATDYVLTNSFRTSESEKKYLYRSILEKSREITDSTGVFADSRLKIMLVFSDCEVYENETPIDPDHYSIQDQLVARAEELGKNDLTNLYFANFRNEETTDETARNLMKLICRDSDGLYVDHFNWPDIKKAILDKLGIDIADFQLTLEIADGMVFKGTNNVLDIHFHDAKTDSILCETKATMREGSTFEPIIVGDVGTTIIVLRGLVLVFFLLVIIYVSFQLVAPFISYQIFLRKYVHEYTGSQMMFNNQPVPDTCYYCKSPFEKGDEIVVKCEHVMHKECWDENNYHCPEYGRHCKNGHHYYNRAHLFDHRNASFYMLWTIMSILAGTTAWLFFTTIGREVGTFILELIFRYAYGLTPNSETYDQQLVVFGYSFQQLPSFGLYIGLFTTFFLCLLTVFMRKWTDYFKECLLRAVVAGIGGWLSFAFVNFIDIIMELSEVSYFLTWIPWPMTGCVIAFCVTWRTRIKFRKWWILASLLLGLISMAIWDSIYTNSIVDYRGSLLISHLVFSLGLGLSIARRVPRSEHYFLRVDGAIKTMDIALYKWLRNNPEQHVTIGKSVNCLLQMSWDINSAIPPLQAEIISQGRYLYLIPKESGVFVDGAPLEPGERMYLFHGTRFTIGKTNFTYLEKDA